MIIRKATKTDLLSLRTLQNHLNQHRNALFNEKNKNFHEKIVSRGLFTKKDLENSVFYIAQ